MKPLKILLFAIIAGSLFTACESLSGRSSAGKPYELLVVVPDNQWDGALGDSIRSILTDTIVRYYQPEPFFDLYKTTPSAFKGNVRTYRNLVIFDLSPEYTRASDTLRYDTYTSSQAVYTIYAPSGSAAAAHLSENREKLQDFFLSHERDFQIARTKRNPNALIEAEIKDMFGIEMSIPSGYKVRNKGDNILWISYDIRLVSQGFIIYTSPVPDEENSDLPLAELRDEYVKFVPGPSAGSYMITSQHIPIDYDREEVNGHPWAVMRGFWDVEGDYMGGPFTNYTTYHPGRDQVISIDAYVHSPDPNKGKRNYMRELENLVHTVKFAAPDANGE